uniref:Uncharacterized protein n=1 Tax=Myoviridae sp. ctwmI4 TaxID=2826710 RepID=A0A8S5LU51_9CAUD|nr:MAG TPA: hypothetical protein [Myoviridae sp. ctwmI4]
MELLEVANLGGALVFAYVVVRTFKHAYESLSILKEENR